MGAAFPHVTRDAVRDTNTLLIGSTTRPSAERLRDAGARHAARARAGGARGRARGSAPGLPGGDVYTDDRAPVEWLVDKSLLDYAEGDGGDRRTRLARAGRPTPCGGLLAGADGARRGRTCSPARRCSAIWVGSRVQGDAGGLSMTAVLRSSWS